ncbi:hypothetical protein [Planomonospora sp. ID82291]|uniref:hypothetical protein n=1 Tax=Planomonospora sp. ID82291 TaxID=2738136 RepID=UPI0018C3CEFB|nr:hypothetical protein [Planomonospora sp. ID82291]MBG0818889.1 hypothetical protein [Planomonospora sp. ID82291]
MYLNWYERLQEETWTDGDGTTTPVAEMDPRHARNVLAWIERQHEGIARAATAALRDVPLPPFHTHAYDEVSVSADAEAAAILADPLAWLAQTPLVQALAHRAALYIGRNVRRLPQPA